MSNLIEAMFQFGVQATQGGLEQDAERDALVDNLESIYKARANAAMQEVDALRQGATEAGRIRMGGSALEGQQRIAFAMGGVDATSGTAAQTIASSRLMSELDVSTSLNNARRQALGHRITQDNLTKQAEAEVRNFKTRQAKRTGDLVAAGASVVGEAISMGMGGGGGGFGGFGGGK